jgi:hypothetical protein
MRVGSSAGGKELPETPPLGSPREGGSPLLGFVPVGLEGASIRRDRELWAPGATVGKTVEHAADGRGRHL